MERGTFQKDEIIELFREYTLLEVFTDRPWEREHYAGIQQSLTGTTALPTYIVLDSENRLEVTRNYYTNDDQAFAAFLREGLKNRPGFYSLLRFSNLNGLTLDGALESSPADEVSYLGETQFAYGGAFWAAQRFQVPTTMEPGRYVLRAELLTALYREEKRGSLVSIPLRLPFEVVK